MRSFHKLNPMIDHVIEVTGYWRWMYITYINFMILNLGINTGCELRNENLSRGVTSCEWCGIKSRNAGREDSTFY